MNLLKNNGWKCLWRGHPAQPTDQLKPRGDQGPGGKPEDEHCLLGGQQLRGARQLLAPRGPCPDTLTPGHTAAVWRAEAPCPREEACPPQLTKASEHAKAGRAATAQTSPVSYWTRPARTAVGTAAVPAPATPLLEWPRCPDPRPGWRVSIRPQPTRAPQGEAMALGPPRGRGPARAVARGPTLSWGVGGTAGGAAAAALRLLLAPGVTRTVAGAPPPPPPAPLRGGRRTPMGPTDKAGCLPRESGGRGSHAAPPPPRSHPLPPAARPGPLSTCSPRTPQTPQPGMEPEPTATVLTVPQ